MPDIGGRDVWRQVAAGLSTREPQRRVNTAVEACERWASDRSRLMLIVRHPDDRPDHWTAFQLARQASRASGMFRMAGVGRGDRVAAVVGRQIEAWVSALGAWRAGITYVPIFGGFGGAAIAQRLQEAKIRHVVVDARFRAAVEAAEGQLPYDLDVTCISGPSGIGVRRGDRSFWSELEQATPSAAVETAADETATLMFTSGTTNTPKACVIPHSGFISLLPFIQHCFAVHQGDLLFSTADPGWSYGLYTTGCAPMALCVPRVIYSGDFDPAAWLRLIDEEQVTFVGAAPTAYRRLLTAAKRQPISSSLLAASSSGEPLDAETVDAWRASTGTTLRDAYGLSELGMVLANLGTSKEHIVPGGLNGPVPGFDVELVDEHGEVIREPEQLGTIAVARPPFPFATNYANAPEAWDARWKNGRFVTGDLAQRDEAGRFFFSGRGDDVIVTSGYNVGPAEVEAILLRHPGVADAAAVAGDSGRGVVVRAVVVRSETVSHPDQLTGELRQAVRDQVGRHAEPRIVDFVDSLPRTETGKLRRAALRESPSVGAIAPGS